MATTNSQQFGELVEYADLALRTSSQLRKCKRGKTVTDEQTLLDAQCFLSAACEGGQFMTTGECVQLQASLKPLNWAADIYFAPPPMGHDQSPPDVDYTKLESFLNGLKSTLDTVVRNQSTDSGSLEECILFFDSLGDILGTRADQLIRKASTPFGDLANT